MKKSLVLSLFLIIALSLYAQTEKRIALVIGNNNYPGKELKNPVNDANLMAQTLESLNFEVIKRTNATKSQMEQAFSEFSGKISKAKVTFIYFAGHGMQIDGVNYLIPIDAKPEKKEQVAWQAIDINTVIDRLKFYPENLNIIVLDACRNNPFRSWVRGDAKGFKRMEAQGTIIGYATCEGCTADDNPTGNNGLYTSILVKELQKPQEIIDVFRNTRFDVMTTSKKNQRPMVSDLSTGRFYLKKAKLNENIRTAAPGKLTITCYMNGTLTIGSNYSKQVHIGEVVEKELNVGQYTVKLNDWQRSFFLKSRENINYETSTAKLSENSTTNTSARINANFNLNVAGLNIAMRGIEGGTFKMGSNSSDAYDDEKPVHTVSVGNFALSKTEITNAQYCKFLNQKGNQTEGGATWLDINNSYCQIENRGGTFYPKSGYDNYPVIEVTWYGAKAYCKWAGGRFPTEAEWKFAARGGVETRQGVSYKYAGSNNIDEVAWYDNNSGGHTHAVAQKKANAFGLYDMSGNVWEWVEDKWHGNYNGAPTNGSAWISGTSSGRVRCGGSWNGSARDGRSSVRNEYAPDSSFIFIGFRLAHSL